VFHWECEIISAHDMSQRELWTALEPCLLREEENV